MPPFRTTVLVVAAALLPGGCGPVSDNPTTPRAASAVPPCSGLLAGPMSMAGVGLDGVPVGLTPNPNSPSDACG